MDLSATPKENQLLAALPAGSYRRLLPDLEAIALRTGETLVRPTGRLLFAYFPTTSIVTSCYAVRRDRAMAKAWPVGREGVLGISLFLGSRKRDNGADVQLGGAAFRLPAAALLAEFKRAGEFQEVLLRYVFALVTQASQLAVCANHHPIEQRLCRFLGRLFDRVSGDEVTMTQERIAELLGVRRVSITGASTRLRAAGIIEYRRGHLKVISRPKLDERACSCGAIIRRAFEAVTG